MDSDNIGMQEAMVSTTMILTYRNITALVPAWLILPDHNFDRSLFTNSSDTSGVIRVAA